MLLLMLLLLMFLRLGDNPPPAAVAACKETFCKSGSRYSRCGWYCLRAGGIGRQHVMHDGMHTHV